MIWRNVKGWIELPVMMILVMILAWDETAQVRAQECSTDGVAPYNEFSIIVCIHGYGYIQPCPQGTRNSPRVMKGVKDEYESVCDENLVGEKGVKAKYPAPSQFKLLPRRRSYRYPRGRQAHYRPQQVKGRDVKTGHRVYEKPLQRSHLSAGESMAHTPLQPKTGSQVLPKTVLLSPMPEPTKPVIIDSPRDALSGSRFLGPALDLNYVPRDAQPREVPSASKQQSVLYGIPRVTQDSHHLPTTTSPQIDPLNNHSKANKNHQNYHKYFMERIRRYGSRESSSREDDGNRGSHKSGTLSSFASLFHNGQPMGYFSITQGGGSQYPSIDFYPVDRYRDVKLPMS